VSSTTGGLTALSGLPTQRPISNYLATEPTGRFVYVPLSIFPNYSVEIYSIGATGSLTLSSPFLQQAFSFGFDPTGAYAYAANDSTGIDTFSINATSGALTRIGTTVAAGTFPDFIVVVSP
jgi:6-phosphogluconolactonase (cycloisomerase 2 family)